MMQPWEEGGYTLDLPDMDDNHREFVELARALAEAGDDDFANLFQNLVDHTRRHFAEEGRLMRLYGFPALAEHEGEHHRIFADLLQFRRQALRGRLALVRAYVRRGLPEWFAIHLQTMDRALALHIQRAQQDRLTT